MSWKAFEDEMSDRVTDEFSEPIRHVPMQRVVNGRPVPDVARATYVTKGIFDWPSTRLVLSKGHDLPKLPGAAVHESRNPTLSLERRDLQHEPREHDRFEIIERRLFFEVVSIEPDGQGRLIAQLTQRGRNSI